MKKIIQNILGALIIGCLFSIPKAEATSGSFSVYLSRLSTTIGSTVTATVTVSSTDALGSWDGTINYDRSLLQLQSSTASGQRMVGYGDGSKKSVSYTFTFKTLRSGTAIVSIGTARIIDYNSVQEIGVVRGSSSVRIMSQAEIEASYSRNNYLASLSIENGALSPEFNKETLEYVVEMEPGTTQINLVGSVEDRTASVDGLGLKEVSEGANRFEIKVTAQNGNVRTYAVVVNVKEYNPIEVTVNGKTLRVIRKKTELTAPANYIETTIKMSEEEVPAFVSEITKYTLVGLKDEEGNAALYVYNADENSYALYREFMVNQITLYPLPYDAYPKRYQQTVVVINDEEVPAYKIKETSHYALIYGMNVGTGKSNLYLFNSDENTLQIYNTEEIDLLKEENELYVMIGLILGGVSLILLLILIIVICKKNKANKHNDFEKPKHKKKKHKKQEEIESILE